MKTMQHRTSRCRSALFLVLIGIPAGCIKHTKPPEHVPVPTAKKVSPRPSGPDVEALWQQMEAEITLANSTDWFDAITADPEVVSEVLIKLLDERVGPCSVWDTEVCDNHHFVEDPPPPPDNARIDDGCAAQMIFLQEADRLTAAARRKHADSLASLPAADLGNAKDLLEVALELAPFKTAIESYAWLAVHSRSDGEDEALLAAIEMTIVAQPKPIQRVVFRILVQQRDDPVAAKWAAESLFDLGEPQFMPEWTVDASLKELAFWIHMYGTEVDNSFVSDETEFDVVPASFISREGLTVRHIVHANIDTLEAYKTPQVTTKHTPWAEDTLFPAPWTKADLETSCNTQTLRCTGGLDGKDTTVYFAAEPGGGYKVREVAHTINFPACLL